MVPSYNTLKIHLRALDLDLEIELKETGEAYQLIAIQSGSEKPGDSGRVWHGKIHQKARVDAFAEKLGECYQSPTKPKQITIADGIRIEIAARIGDSNLRFVITEVEKGTREQALLSAMMDLVQEATGVEDSPKWELAWLGEA